MDTNEEITEQNDRKAGDGPWDPDAPRERADRDSSDLATGILASVVLGMLLTYAVIALLRGQTATVAVGTPVVLGAVAVGLARRAVQTSGADYRRILVQVLRMLAVPAPDLDDDGLPATPRHGGIGARRHRSSDREAG